MEWAVFSMKTGACLEGFGDKKMTYTEAQEEAERLYGNDVYVAQRKWLGGTQKW